MTQTKSVTAGLVVIGDEILSGRTQDANIAYLAKWLNEEGVVLHEVRIVGDDRDAGRGGGPRGVDISCRWEPVDVGDGHAVQLTRVRSGLI